MGLGWQGSLRSWVPSLWSGRSINRRQVRYLKSGVSESRGGDWGFRRKK